MNCVRLRIKTLSPVHVGTGEVYEPTEFFVHPEGYLGVLDFEKFIAHFTERELKAFKNLCREGTLKSLVNLYRLIDALAQSYLKQGIDDFTKRRISLCQGFLSHYEKIKTLRNNPQQLKREFNRFTIQRTAFSPNEEVPIIPGSAVKGAIRTAVLNNRRFKVQGKSWRDYCQQKNPHRPPRCDSKQLESEILGYPKFKFQYDPFRLVKVSDFRPVEEVKTRIVYAVNRKKGGGQARGPYQILEVVEPGAVFEGEITLLEPEEHKDAPKTRVDFKEIREALKNFYGRESEREFDEVKKIGGNIPVFSEGGFPLRVGRHSGAECVTIEGFRHILVRGPRGRNTYQDHATTLWLASEFPHTNSASGLKPFGWCALYEAEKDLNASKEHHSSPQLDVSKLGSRFKLVVKKK